MKKENISYEAALAALKSSYPLAKPNLYFEDQLLSFEQKLKQG